MICLPGKCIKCAGGIIVNGKAGPNYCELECRLSNGSILHIGICSACHLEENEFQAAIDALNDWFAAQGAVLIKHKIVSVIDRIKTVEMRLKQQGNRCLGCHERIDRKSDKYICTIDGMVLHEFCNPPRAKHKYDDPRALGNVSEKEARAAAKRGGVFTRKSADTRVQA